jgi:hypothetical protein
LILNDNNNPTKKKKMRKPITDDDNETEMKIEKKKTADQSGIILRLFSVLCVRVVRQ